VLRQIAPDGSRVPGNRKVEMMNLLNRFKSGDSAAWLRVALGLVLALAVCLAPTATTVVVAQEEAADSEEKQGEEKDKKPAIQHKVTVTATRTKEDTFNVPQPVAVVTREEIAKKNPNTSTDLLRELPGVDVNGVGTNQPRPSSTPALTTTP